MGNNSENLKILMYMFIFYFNTNHIPYNPLGASPSEYQVIMHSRLVVFHNDGTTFTAALELTKARINSLANPLQRPTTDDVCRCHNGTFIYSAITHIKL